VIAVVVPEDQVTTASIQILSNSPFIALFEISGSRGVEYEV
jgi:hypothetical protein